MLFGRAWSRLGAAFLLAFSISLLNAGQPAKAPVPKAIKLDPLGKGDLSLLGGPPDTSTMRAGLVVLEPGRSVGRHNTENYEELVIVLQGQAEMRITGGQTMRLTSGWAAYCPSHTEHDVFNTGSTVLKYIYIVAEVK